MVEKQGGKGEVFGRCCVVKGLALPPGLAQYVAEPMGTEVGV